MLFHVHNHTVARVLNYELAALNDEHRIEIEAIRTDIDRELRDLVQSGVAAGAFHTPNPALAATAIASMTVDIARWYLPGGEWTPEEIADYYADLMSRLAGATELAL